MHEWNSQGIKIWFFPRNEIPIDITEERPNPSSWSLPVAAWSSKFCDFSSALYQHSLIIDTTICGDWAGPAYPNSGCPGTCAEAVADPSNFVGECVVFEIQLQQILNQISQRPSGASTIFPSSNPKSASCLSWSTVLYERLRLFLGLPVDTYFMTITIILF